MKVNSYCLQLIAFIVLVGRSSSSFGADSAAEFQAYLQDPTAQRVAVQVCLPNRTAFFDDVTVNVADMPANVPIGEVGRMLREATATQKYENPYRLSGKNELVTIRQWRTPQSPSDYPKTFVDISKVSQVRSVLSAGGSSPRLLGSTESNQIVFYAYTNDRPVDLKAMYVKLPLSDDNDRAYVTYWYKPPQRVNQKNYSEWIAPISEDRPDRTDHKHSIWTYVTQGREMPIYPVSENAPRIRYLSMTNVAESHIDDELRRARYTLQLQGLVKGVQAKFDPYIFVPAKREKIPPC